MSMKNDEKRKKGRVVVRWDLLKFLRRLEGIENKKWRKIKLV